MLKTRDSVVLYGLIHLCSCLSVTSEVWSDFVIDLTSEAPCNPRYLVWESKDDLQAEIWSLHGQQRETEQSWFLIECLSPSSAFPGFILWSKHCPWLLEKTCVLWHYGEQCRPKLVGFCAPCPHVKSYNQYKMGIISDTLVACEVRAACRVHKAKEVTQHSWHTSLF